MQKKLFRRDELLRLLAARSEGDASTLRANRVVDPIIAYAVYEALSQHSCYGRYMQFGEFIEGIDDAHTGWSEVVAPLVIFRHYHDGLWSAAAVVSYQSDHLGVSYQRHAMQFLQQVDIAHLIITARQVEQRYLQSTEFKSALKQTVFHRSPTGALDDQEEFQSEPRPIYPPRRLISGD